MDCNDGSTVLHRRQGSLRFRRDNVLHLGCREPHLETNVKQRLRACVSGIPQQLAVPRRIARVFKVSVDQEVIDDCVVCVGTSFCPGHKFCSWCQLRNCCSYSRRHVTVRLRERRGDFSATSDAFSIHRRINYAQYFVEHSRRSGRREIGKHKIHFTNSSLQPGICTRACCDFIHDAPNNFLSIFILFDPGQRPADVNRLFWCQVSEELFSPFRPFFILLLFISKLSCQHRNC